MKTNETEQEKGAREIADLIIADLNDRQGLHISDCPEFAQQEIREDFTAIIQKQLDQQTAHLQEQLQLKEAMVGRCVEMLQKVAEYKNYREPVSYDVIKSADTTLQQLPSTPNYVKRCEELEKLLKRVKPCTLDRNFHSASLEKLCADIDQTLNNQAE